MCATWFESSVKLVSTTAFENANSNTCITGTEYKYLEIEMHQELADNQYQPSTLVSANCLLHNW